MRRLLRRLGGWAWWLGQALMAFALLTFAMNAWLAFSESSMQTLRDRAILSLLCLLLTLVARAVCYLCTGQFNSRPSGPPRQ